MKYARMHYVPLHVSTVIACRRITVLVSRVTRERYVILLSARSAVDNMVNVKNRTHAGVSKDTKEQPVMNLDVIRPVNKGNVSLQVFANVQTDTQGSGVRKELHVRQSQIFLMQS